MSTAKPKKKGGIKLVLFIVLPLLLVGGGVVGAAFMGVINIPGLTPAKKGKLAHGAQSMYGEQAKVEPAKPAPPRPKKEVATKPPAEPPKPDMDLGAKKLAKIWNEISVDGLMKIIEKWSDEDVARVLAKMDTSKVAQLLASLASSKKAERAGKLSELMQLQAAVVAQK